MGIKDNMFATIGLGLADSKKIKEVSVRDNLISKIHVKTIETLMRYCDNLFSFDISKNLIDE